MANFNQKKLSLSKRNITTNLVSIEFLQNNNKNNKHYFDSYFHLKDFYLIEWMTSLTLTDTLTKYLTM